MLALTACTGDQGGKNRPPGASSLELRPDGIGPYLVGDPAEEVIAGISEAIGGWDADSDDAESTLQVPTCTSGDGVVLPTRLVSWGNLVLLFTGPDTSATLHTWTYGFDPVTGNAEDVRTLGLTTVDGVGLGMPRPQVESLLGDRLEVVDDETLDQSVFTIDGTVPEHVAGRFTSIAPDGLVQILERQPNCAIALP
jgi:hypothetical protein